MCAQGVCTVPKGCVCPRGVCAQGVCVPKGCVCPRGVSCDRRGVCARRAVCVPKGCVCPRGVCAQGVCECSRVCVLKGPDDVLKGNVCASRGPCVLIGLAVVCSRGT